MKHPTNQCSKSQIMLYGVYKLARVWDKTGGRCYYCGCQLRPGKSFTVDHYISKDMGGDNRLANLVPCCPSCNSSKGNKLPDNFRDYLRRCFVTPSGRRVCPLTDQQMTYLEAEVGKDVVESIFPEVVFYGETLP